MTQFVISGRAADDSGLTIEGTLIVRENEAPKNLTITPDIVEPVGGYVPGTVVTYTLAAEDATTPTYEVNIMIDGVSTPLSRKADTTDQFVFAIPQMANFTLTGTARNSDGLVTTKTLLVQSAPPLKPQVSLFTSQMPAAPNTTEPGPQDYELGMRFACSASGAITGIRYWRAAGETGTHTGRIATSWGAAVGARSERIKEIDRALALTASVPKGEPQPIGYISPGTERMLTTDANGAGFVVAAAGWDTIIPVYTSSPPAAGWDEATNWLEGIANNNGNADQHVARRAVELLKSGQALRREAPASSGVAEDPLWQKLRDLFGLDGWYDGIWHGVPNPQQIVTHVEHVAKERARLLKESLSRPDAGGGVRETLLRLPGDNSLPDFTGYNSLAVLLALGIANILDDPRRPLADRELDAVKHALV